MKMQGFLDEMTSDNQDDLISRHPYAGPLNIAETLDFIEIHFGNHVRSIDKVLAQK